MAAGTNALSADRRSWAGSGRRGDGPVRALTWVALAVSVALNVFFLIGYYRAAVLAERVETPAGTAEVIAERLGLDSGQRAIFDRVRAEARADARSYTAKASATVNAYWAEMVAEAPDPVLLEQYLSQAAERNLAFNRVITKRMRTFLAALTPRQRREFVDRVRSRPVLRGRFLMSGG